MSQEALDLRKFLRTIRRYRVVVGLAAALGLVVGAALTMLQPPVLTSKTLVVLPATRDIQTQVVVAGSDPVLVSALRQIRPAVSLDTLRGRVHVSSLTSNVLSISAQGSTAAQAEASANAVASSYLSYVRSSDSPGGRALGQVLGQVLERAATASGTSLLRRLLSTGGLCALLGALAGAIVALVISRNDRRLGERDEIADAIGAPVLASIPVSHPTDAAGWARLLGDYEPGAVHAWSLRKALHHLGLTDFKGGSGNGASVAIFSLSADRGALALGPQLAVFAASLGIPTALVIGSQQDPDATATLCAACTVMPAVPTERSSTLRITVGDKESGGPEPGAALTVAVAVVDGRTPRVAGTMRTTATVLGVSAGAATAEQLARFAVSAVRDGRQIAGIIVADPESTDHTTGRLPQPAGRSQRRLPTRLTGSTTLEQG